MNTSSDDFKHWLDGLAFGAVFMSIICFFVFISGINFAEKRQNNVENALMCNTLMKDSAKHSQDSLRISYLYKCSLTPGVYP